MLEQEIKLTADCIDTLDAIKQSSLIVPFTRSGLSTSSFPLPTPKHFLAVYYDTPEGHMASRQCSLRSRKEGDQWKAALKFKGQIIDGLSIREEFECEIDGWLTCVDDLPESELRTKVLGFLDANATLSPRVTVDMQRTVMMLQFRHCLVEMVLDQAEITGKQNQRMLYEVELELKSGEIDEMLALADALKLNYPLVPSTQTKHQIGLSL